MRRRAPQFDKLIESWDMAFKDSDCSDYVVGQVWGRYGAEEYLLHQVRAKLEFTATLQAVRELTNWVQENFPAHRAHAKLVEDKANGPAVISTLHREIHGLIAADPQGARSPAPAPSRPTWKPATSICPAPPTTSTRTATVPAPSCGCRR